VQKILNHDITAVLGSDSYLRKCEVFKVKMSGKQTLYMVVESLKFPRFSVSQISNCQQMNLGISSALNTTRLYPQGKYSWYSFLLEAKSNSGFCCDRKDLVNASFQ